MKAMCLLIVFFTILVISWNASAATLFMDDFEAGLSDNWIIGHLSGQSAWEVVELDGNSVLKVDSTGDGWTGATVDGVASLQEHDELWATCKFMAQQNLGSCNELGLLANPDSPTGNWYLSTCEGGAEIGIDQCAVAWHSRVAHPWELDQWYNMKVMVSQDGVMYGKMWPVDDDESEDWDVQVTMSTHLDEDGVGFMSYFCVTYFDDIIVASAEEALTMAVESAGKLSTSWGLIRSANISW